MLNRCTCPCIQGLITVHDGDACMLFIHTNTFGSHYTNLRRMNGFLVYNNIYIAIKVMIYDGDACMQILCASYTTSLHTVSASVN